MADSANFRKAGKLVESAGIIELYISINTKKGKRKERKK
jgi:hypothetical protein